MMIVIVIIMTITIESVYKSCHISYTNYYILSIYILDSFKNEQILPLFMDSLLYFPSVSYHNITPKDMIFNSSTNKFEKLNHHRKYNRTIVDRQ